MQRLRIDKIDKWDKRFLSLAKFVSSWSKDPSTKCGAVIADSKHRIVSLGFNGYPSDVPDDFTLNIREEKYLRVIHSEVNAILFSNRENMQDCTLYVCPLPPCPNCAGTIIQKGIKRVVSLVENQETIQRWQKKIDISVEMFNYADVSLIVCFANEEGII